jgi:hypothetical protein
MQRPAAVRQHAAESLLEGAGELRQRLDPAADRPLMPPFPEPGRRTGELLTPQVLQVVLQHVHLT